MPTIITNVTELQAMSADLAGVYELGNDIDASATSTWNAGAGFDPIGTAASKFTGSFDGRGYAISDLTINRPTEDYVGLFGYLAASAGNIQNVGLVDCAISGQQFVGALVGYIDPSGTMTISGCSSTGSVSSVKGSVGGLLGYHNATTLTGCYSTCSVTATGGANNVSEVGGLVGQSDGTITQCYATGAVTATSNGDIEEVGGLIGLISNGSTTKSYASGNVSATAGARARGIGGVFGYYASNDESSDCYARGNITVSVGNTAWGEIGGFAGIADDASAIIDDCYSTGLLIVTLSVPNIGGFCGDNFGTITNCFWDTTTSGTATSDGGTGKTTAQMKTESTFTDAGWDFTTIWNINTSLNNGYPNLTGVSGVPTVTTQAVSSISTTTATGNGNITDLKGENATAHGVCYNTTGSPTTADSTTDEGAASSTGAFTTSMTGLDTNTKYYVKAYATNGEGTGYGSEVNFTTLEAPTVTTKTCESVVGATATGRGNITDLGNPNPTAHGHCWNTSTNPTTADNVVDNGAASATGTFTSSITGLTPGTGYYTRAYATNTAGTSYGANVYFTASKERAGYTWDEVGNLRSFDANAIERQYIHTDDVDDIPVNGATTAPVSSNWAFDHDALTTGTHGVGAGVIVGTTLSQELTNKTLDASVAKGTWTASGTWTIPAVTLNGDITGGNHDLDNIGHIGLANNAADADIGLYYDETISDISTVTRGIYFSATADRTTSATAAYLNGGFFKAQIDNSNTQNWTRTQGLIGVWGMVTLITGTASASTITGAASLFADVNIGEATNDMVLTNYYGLYIEAETLVGNSKLTNDYGIYVASQAGGATLNYAVYTNAGLVHFGDDVDLSVGKTVDGVDVKTIQTRALMFALCS